MGQTVYFNIETTAQPVSITDSAGGAGCLPGLRGLHETAGAFYKVSQRLTVAIFDAALCFHYFLFSLNHVGYCLLSQFCW